MDTKKIKILYAEDNRITAQETGEALEDNGYEVKTVFDGDEYVRIQYIYKKNIKFTNGYTSNGKRRRNRNRSIFIDPAIG